MVNALISGYFLTSFHKCNNCFVFVCMYGCTHVQMYMQASKRKSSLLSEAGSLAEPGTH